MAKEQKIEHLELSSIDPDENQPRKNFNPERLSDLMKSIKRHGIMHPLVVEKTSGGRYKLVDGERRFRAAKQLDLKEVPCLVVAAQSETQRLIQQFHLQEQHQGWSPLEKAVAVASLATELDVTVPELAEMLSLPTETVRDYTAFSHLLERREYEKSEVSIGFAPAIVRLRAFTKRQYEKVLNEEFPIEMERALEKAIIHRLKMGTMSQKGDILKLHDAIKAETRSVERFIKDSKVSADKLFIESNARTAWLFRNVNNLANQMNTHIARGLELKLSGMYEKDDINYRALKRAYDHLGNLIDQI